MHERQLLHVAAPAMAWLLIVAIAPVAACTVVPTTSPASPTPAPPSPITTSSPPSMPAPSTVAPSTVAPSPPPSANPTPWPTLPAFGWVDLLGEQRTYGGFVIEPDAAKPAELVVRLDGKVVGHVLAGRLATEAWGSDLGTLGSLLDFARNYVQQFRDDRLGLASGSTFDAIGPAADVVGSARGVQFGWTWRDGDGKFERSMSYIASIPGGIVWFQAISGDAVKELPWSTFSDDAAYVRFLPILDEIVAGVRLPY